jgi:hypothetical protein
VGRDVCVLALEQRATGQIAFDEEWPEILKVEHPDRLRKAEFLKPVDVDDTFDAAAKQSSGPIAGRITTADRWGVGTGPA